MYTFIPERAIPPHRIASPLRRGGTQMEEGKNAITDPRIRARPRQIDNFPSSVPFFFLRHFFLLSKTTPHPNPLRAVGCETFVPRARTPLAVARRFCRRRRRRRCSVSSLRAFVRRRGVSEEPAEGLPKRRWAEGGRQKSVTLVRRCRARDHAVDAIFGVFFFFSGGDCDGTPSIGRPRSGRHGEQLRCVPLGFCRS